MEQQNNKTGETAGRPELTQDQLCKVDSLLMRWAAAGLCVYGKNHAGETIVRVDGLVRMLRTLAHCAWLAGMQDLVAGRRDENRGPDMAIGFIAASKAVSYLASQCSTDAVKLCKSDPHEYLSKDWNEIFGSRDHVIGDIERVAPGWYAKAQALASKVQEKAPRTVLVSGAGWHVVAPDSGYAERVAKARAGIRRKGLGEIRLDTVTQRLYAHLGGPEELLYKNYEKAAERIKAELSKKWLDELVDFIGEYESRYGERLSDNEVRYLHELVNGDITHERYMGHARLVGLERRDVRLKPEDFGGGKS